MSLDTYAAMAQECNDKRELTPQELAVIKAHCDAINKAMEGLEWRE